MIIVAAASSLLAATLSVSPVFAREESSSHVSSLRSIPDRALRGALIARRRGEELRVIVPDGDAVRLAELGFDIGKRVGGLPFQTATASRQEILRAADLGLTSGVSLDRMIPMPSPVAIPDWRKPFIMNASELTGASRLHAQGITGKGTAIAVIDTGIQASHPYFRDEAGRSRVVAESCFVSTEYFTPDLPCPGGQDRVIGPGAADIGSDMRFAHGTHVAGIAAGNAAMDPKAEGYTGIAPDANLVISRVFGSFGAIDSDISAALAWVASQASVHSISAVNLSLGFYSSRYLDCTSFSDSIYGEVTARLQAAGVAIVAASGNNGGLIGIGTPACGTGWVSVGATDELSRVAAFSNVSDDLDLIAPGTAIWSSMPGNEFAELSGTSMASPVVAGAFALLREALPGTTAAAGLAAMRASGPRFDDIIVQDLPTLRVDLAYSQLTAGTVVGPYAPAPPSQVIATPRSQAVSVRWTPGADGGAPITGYFAVSDPGGTICFAKSTETGCILGNLTDGTPYTVTVWAQNAFGASLPSQPSAPVVPSDQARPPTAVTDLKAAGVTGGIRITWGPPEMPEEADGVSYRYRVGSGPWIPTTSLSAQVKAKPRTPVTIRVRAVSAFGMGPVSILTATAR